MRLNSLAFRLFATAAMWTLLVLPLAGVIIYQLYRDDVRAGFDERLEKLVNSLAIDALSGGGSQPVTPPNRYEPLFEETHSGWYWQIKPLDDPSARRLVSASLATSSLPSPFDLGVPADGAGQRWLNSTGPTGEPIRIVEVIDSNGHVEGGPRYSVTVAGPIAWLETRYRKFLARLATALALTGFGLVTVTLFQVRFGLSPLRKIEKGLAAVRSGEATALAGDLPVEIEPLQVELNALIQSNQDIVDRARTQVGNLAHVLKTPLAVITNEAREDESPFGEKVAEQAQIMRDQITSYLDRARMAARVGVGRSTEVAPVIASIVRALERIYREQDIKIEVSGVEGLKFQGEQQDLEEMVGNLLDNACKWAGGHVFLSASGPERNGRGGPGLLRIVVEDNGPGLTPEQRSRIGKRGQRLDETIPGSGLGLSIVADLVQLYRGNLELSESPRGGLAVCLELPSI